MKELQVEKKRKSDEEEDDLLRLKKRWKEAEKGDPDIKFVIEQLSLREPGGHISTAAFLSVSELMLHVIDRIGPTMAVLGDDVRRNIERLENSFMADPSANSCLKDVIKKEVDAGTSRARDSTCRAVLWLTRSMDFSIALVEKLEGDDGASLERLVEEAYEMTLKPWHSWIASAAYRVALKLVPQRRKLMELVVGDGQNRDSLKERIRKLASLMPPLLCEIHALLAEFRLDRMKSA